MRWCTLLLLVGVPLGLLGADVALAGKEFQAGFAKVDITPTEPLRLSGYSNRKEPYQRIEQKLWVRAMVVRPPGGKPHALVAVDTIGVPGSLTARVAAEAQKRFGIPRAALVLACSHSHTAPQLAGGIPNMYQKPLTPQEKAAMQRYTRRVGDAVLEAIAQALGRMQPASWAWAQSRATFAVNRRLVENGRYRGFGVNRQGPVDHALPVLAVRSKQGKLLGVVFNYACHCTTLGPQHNFVCGDWAGYASQFLEQRHPGIVAVCTIGCGADANPEPRTGLNYAKQHGTELADQVDALLRQAKAWKPLPGEIRSAFAPAALPFEEHDEAYYRQRLKNPRPVVQRHAAHMLQLLAQGHLPRSYPCPVHVWRVGDLGLVFLGGEVVVDYALRLKKELPGVVWISGYCDDVFAYVASRRVIAEGGYEVDFSMVFYNQPGRWKPEVEEVLVGTVHRLWKQLR